MTHAHEMGREDFYRILNVPRTASRTQIRESYVRLQNTFSSQSQSFYGLFSDDEAQEVLRKVELAFRTLNDDHTRRAYDRDMGWSSAVSSDIAAENFEATDHIAWSGIDTAAVQDVFRGTSAPPSSRRESPTHSKKNRLPLTVCTAKN